MRNVAVLLVEDDSDLSEALRLYLDCQGFSVKVATDGGEALTILFQSKKTIDVVVTDLMMPGVDGIELIRQLRNCGELKDLPVIAMTASDEGFIAQAKDAGVDVVLRKPGDFDILADTIDQTVEQKAA
ncbi:MAG TPA: response regulator [Blastocatellia bacterium]|nr:response regulator [Blastocatellia bacterium]